MLPEHEDIISADRRPVPRQVPWVVAAALLAVALAGATAVAVHYHSQVSALRHRLGSVPPVPSSPVGPPAMSVSTVALPSSGVVTGELTVFVVQRSGAPAQIVLSARISGGRPHTRYTLSGNDCAGAAPDRSWITGVTDARGSADLSGHTWTITAGHEYWLWLSPSSMSRAPGLHGSLAPGGVMSAFPAGQAPCAVG